MRMKTALANGVVTFVLLFSSLACLAQDSHIGKLTGNAKRGKSLYERYCIFCHSARGDGMGENTPHLDPKPRDFIQAKFKCRSNCIHKELLSAIPGRAAGRSATDTFRAGFLA